MKTIHHNPFNTECNAPLVTPAPLVTVPVFIKLIVYVIKLQESKVGIMATAMDAVSGACGKYIQGVCGEVRDRIIGCMVLAW